MGTIADPKKITLIWEDYAKVISFLMRIENGYRSRLVDAIINTPVFMADVVVG